MEYILPGYVYTECICLRNKRSLQVLRYKLICLQQSQKSTSYSQLGQLCRVMYTCIIQITNDIILSNILAIECMLLVLIEINLMRS